VVGEFGGFIRVKGGERENYIPERLSQNTAQPQHYHRSELGIAEHTRGKLSLSADHPLHDEGAVASSSSDG